MTSTETSDEFKFADYDNAFDPKPADIIEDASVADVNGANTQRRVAVIRNSDRVLFRRCRRRWAWNSHLRGNLGPRTTAAPLWLGSGFHFALEDYHGHRRYPTAMAAFDAYVLATQKLARRQKNVLALPADWQDQAKLAKNMLQYYTESWLLTRDPLQTFWYNGEPQCEVNFRVDLPVDYSHYGWDKVIYSGTLDRVAIDEHGRLWVLEYKSAKIIQTLHLAYDGQVNSYTWIGKHLYPGYEIAGVIYQQHLKDFVEPPRMLANGKLSTNKQMRTTHALYRRELLNLYGGIDYAPKENVEFLNFLAGQEDPDKDKFIRRDRAYRNDHQCQAEGTKILMELSEMLNPDLPLYPNPTRECAHMCNFNGPCVSLDDGSDFQYELDIMFEPRAPVYDSWRQYLDDSTPLFDV